ncbi:hypothetical protein [Winogradskyella sp. 3972H.M.0a.05]|uniref:hypothetical protein n=1 Tax=Winogradskyella sp. 3972H.M.0a.05 TaxID=2950277 RepID=UPI0033946886
MKTTLFILAITLSFFLGRESKTLNDNPSYITSPSFQSDLDPIQSFSNYTLPVLNDTTKVYRCGQSKIYHPSTSHASFKRCKSTVYILSVKRAKELGMRHCKCSG